MVTKAELEAELAALRREMADRDSGGATRTEQTEPSDEEVDDTAASMRKALTEALKSHGLDPSDLDLDALWQQLSDEAGDLMQKRPALSAIAIFTLGFMLGRASKG